MEEQEQQPNAEQEASKPSRENTGDERPYSDTTQVTEVHSRQSFVSQSALLHELEDDGDTVGDQKGEDSLPTVENNHGGQVTPHLPGTLQTHGHSQKDTSVKKSKWMSKVVQTFDVIFDDVGGEEEGDEENEEKEKEEDVDGITVVSPPPTGHGNDFYCITRQHGFYTDSDPYFPEKNTELWDKTRLIVKVANAVGPKDKLRPEKKENRDSMRRGIRFMDMISKVPLSKVWHRTTQILAIMVFLANVVVSIYDIAREVKYLYYKVPALVLSVVENTVLVILWFVFRSPKYREGKDKERSVKHQQYTENILHEVLLYPLLVIAAFGFATEKMYQEPDDAFGWAQLILLIIDVIELIWTQVVRMIMTYKLFRDIQKVIRSTEVKYRNGCCGWTTSGWILLRTYITVIGNVVTFLVLLAMLILQVHYDNLNDGDYHITWRSGLIMLCFLLLPLYSIVVYFLANAFWALELLLRVNIRVSSDATFQMDLTQTYGEMISDALAFSMSKIQTNEEKLNELRTTKFVKKLIYGAIAPLNAILLVIWQVSVVTAVLVLNAFDDSTTNRAIQIMFGLLLICTNFHVFFVAIVADIIVIGLFLGGVFYPCTIGICFRETYTARLLDEQPQENMKYL